MKFPVWAVISTVFLLLLVAVFYLFVLLVALNGVPENQALLAMGIWLVCHLTILAFAGYFARWLTQVLMTKVRWNRFLTLAFSTFVGTLLGASASFLAILFSILVARIR